MKEKIGLICEGGGTKAAYTCGVLHAFLDNGIHIPYCVGISAGAEVLLSYVEKNFKELAFFANKTVEFALASLGNDAGIIGAAKLALDNQ